MTLNSCFVLCVLTTLVGCNRPTPYAEIAVPHFSTAPYEHLDCQHLKVKHDNLGLIVQELENAQDNRGYDSIGHTIYYGWGTGDSMATVEFSKALGERDAVSRVYDKKGCVGRDEDVDR